MPRAAALGGVRAAENGGSEAIEEELRERRVVGALLLCRAAATSARAPMDIRRRRSLFRPLLCIGPLQGSELNASGRVDALHRRPLTSSDLCPLQVSHR